MPTIKKVMDTSKYPKFHKTKDRIYDALSDVNDELLKAMKAYAPMHNEHEAYAVIKEEVEEFWAEVKMKPDIRDSARMRTELIQVAAMAIRAIVDVVDRAPKTETTQAPGSLSPSLGNQVGSHTAGSQRLRGVRSKNENR